MTEKDKRRDIDRLCGGGGVVFTGSGTKAKKHPGQVRRPGRSGGTGSKGFFKAAVDLIHYTVGGGMVGGGGDEGDIKEGGEGGPETGSKLRAAIRGDAGRNTKAGYPGG